MQSWAKRLFLLLLLAVVPNEVLADDVETILKAWARHTADRPVRGLHGSARIYQYDEVFQTETRGRLEFWVSGPEEWRVDSAPVKIDGLKSTLHGANGKAYELRARGHERYSQSATVVTREIGNALGPPERRQFELRHIADGWRNDEEVPDAGIIEKLGRFFATLPSDISELPPGIVSLACDGPSADFQCFQFCRRDNWHVTLGTSHAQRGRIHLVLLPKSARLQQTFSSVELLVNATDFRPIGVRLNDSTGSSNVVYAFEGVGAVPYDADPFGPTALAAWPPVCGAPSDGDRPPPPPVATPLAG